MKTEDIPLYVVHPGTVKIAGHTECKLAAKCALHHLSRNIGPIDFFYVGANAGQQAMKAMGIMRYLLEQTTEGKSTVFFQPNRVRTQSFQAGSTDTIDAVYWRVYVLPTEKLTEFTQYGS